MRKFGMRKAAMIMGLSIVGMFILAILVDNFLLSNFIGPAGDTDALARDIAACESSFRLAATGYLFILVLDAAIAVALYFILRQVNRKLASLMSALRLLYVSVMAIAVLALLFRLIDVHSYESLKLVGYAFFTAHIFALGYLVFKSGYIPRSLGAFLLAAFVSYLFMLFGGSVYEFLFPILVIPAALAELFLGIWLLLNRNKLPGGKK
jgi:hypothetical protein